jgi:hypothetical protein
MVLLALAAWVTLEFSMARGMFYTLTKPLPILKSLHINIRFVSAFIIPMVIIGSILSHKFLVRNQGVGYFSVYVALTFLSLFSYFLLSAPIHQRYFDMGFSIRAYRNIRGGNISPVTAVADIDVWQGFSEGESSFKPYEPIFGYDLEAFRPLIHLGSVFETEAGYFNMTNPASLVFPDVNNTRPFERIRSNDSNKLEIFVNRRQPDWNIPLIQTVLNRVSLISLIILLGVLLTTSRR